MLEPDEEVGEEGEQFLAKTVPENGTKEELEKRSSRTRSDVSHHLVIAESREVQEESVATLID